VGEDVAVSVASTGPAETIGSFDRRRRLAKLVFAGTIATIAVSAVLIVTAARTSTGGWWVGGLENYGLTLIFAAFPVVGVVLATKRPDNSLGWVCLAIGVIIGLEALIAAYATYALHGGPGGRAAAGYIEAIDQGLWLPIIAIPTTYMLLLFPTGHLPSPRWRWFAWMLGVSLVLAYVAITLTPGPMTETVLKTTPNPLGIGGMKSVFAAATVIILMLPIGMAATIVSLIQRFRRADEVTRAQLRWVVLAASTVGALYALIFLLSINTSWGGATTPRWLAVLQNAALVSFTLIPIAIAIAVLRYHLFDIDLVINRALVIAVLVAFITIIYVGIVVGIGTVVGARTSPVLSALAAAVVAIAFQPMRHRAHRLADRVVYGERATPYEVLSSFADRLGSTFAQADLLQRMALALAQGTGAEAATVFIRSGEDLVPRATWPEDAEPLPSPAVVATDAYAAPGGMVTLVRHDAEVLGALAIRKRPTEDVTPTERRLVEDVAAQAGLVLRNLALTEQLQTQLEELRASRQRLVVAQDGARRRLERNIHDGAQQQLVALAIKERLAEALIGRDDAKARGLLEELQHDTTEALETLRDLAHGIYPPLLADRGLAAAVEAQGRKAPVPVTVRADGLGRFPQEIEAAVYFSVLEALQNVGKYAGASAVVVTLAQDDGHVGFMVSDDGRGFDPRDTGYGSGLQGIADRLGALDGTLVVRSSPGEGTEIWGQIPLDGRSAARGASVP
jgi:signal transduction histidine kinase